MGIENYRMGILQPDPSTFFIPTHWDADTLFFVARDKQKWSVNRQNLSNIHVVQSFFGGRGEDPDSFFKSFSVEILEAAFNREKGSDDGGSAGVDRGNGGSGRVKVASGGGQRG
ncbi:hypothetical protein LguiA_020413 [Lonicera macranthoides]